MKTNLISIKTVRTAFMLILWQAFILSAISQDTENLLLKNYRPQSIYNIPVTQVERASFPVIDIHSHPYAPGPKEIDRWVEIMDSCGIQKAIILTMATGAKFDSIVKTYAGHKSRFDLWCGFDYTGYDLPGFPASAVKELERCYHIGAKGVGELGDKGLGEIYSEPVAGVGMHIDDPRMKPLFEKCAELNMPVNIHVGDPVWMYERMDSTNDGLMNALTWRIDMNQPGILDLQQLVKTLEYTLRENPKTIFIACHYANLMHDLTQLGKLLEKYPNLYADISARYAETATIPRYMKAFIERYQDRLLYGTDMGYQSSMYRTTFRMLESADEHFYEIELFGYHWPLHGFGLSPVVLKKLYSQNAALLLK